ncbi:MAG: haloalkane dehalogenase [Pseudomonadota bacterium]
MHKDMMMGNWANRKQYTEVLGSKMAHVAMGQGSPVLFLHGNPTSSFLWRDVMAEVEVSATCFAPDLIGMGDSDKLPESGPDRYTIAEHARYLDAWIDAVLPPDPVVLVIHDWGGALGFNWARRNAGRVRGIAYMETIVRPMDWDEFNQDARPVFEGLRSPAGEEMILEKNIFVDRILTGSIMRDLLEDEMAEYRRPFLEAGEGRRPTLTFPRQIPLGGEPADVVEMAAASYEWLKGTDVPKLLVDADPGAIMKGAVLEDARKFANQTEVQVKGSHFIQEDSGAEIGSHIRDWLAGI